MVLNTSFNRGGEPIVETPEDALACCRNTEIDLLATDNFVVDTSQSRLRKQS
jgi:carbamoyltransferase